MASWGSSCLAKANAVSGDNGTNDFVISYTQKENSAPTKMHSQSARSGNGPVSTSRGRPLCGGLSSFGGAEMQHKAVVEPVFLSYNQVSTETRHTLMQVATAVAQSMGDYTAVDAVQPMRTG